MTRLQPHGNPRRLARNDSTRGGDELHFDGPGLSGARDRRGLPLRACREKEEETGSYRAGSHVCDRQMARLLEMEGEPREGR